MNATHLRELYPPANRFHFEIRNFAKLTINNLGNPMAGNFYQAQDKTIVSGGGRSRADVCPLLTSAVVLAAAFFFVLLK